METQNTIVCKMVIKANLLDCAQIRLTHTCNNAKRNEATIQLLHVAGS